MYDYSLYSTSLSLYICLHYIYKPSLSHLIDRLIQQTFTDCIHELFTVARPADCFPHNESCYRSAHRLN